MAGFGIPCDSSELAQILTVYGQLKTGAGFMIQLRMSKYFTTFPGEMLIHLWLLLPTISHKSPKNVQ